MKAREIQTLVRSSNFKQFAGIHGRHARTANGQSELLRQGSGVSFNQLSSEESE